MPSLGKDLTSIRNREGLSIEDVQRTTKIPQHIIRSIEDNSIFEQIKNNTTYTRSYVRSYAKAIHIKEEEIVRALNQVEKENYDGHLGEVNNITHKPDEEIKKLDAEDKNHSSGDKNDMVHDHAPNQPSKEKPEAAPPKQIKPKKTDSSALFSSVDWVDVGRKANPAPSKSRFWPGLIILFIIVIILAAGFFFYFYYNAEQAEQQTEPLDNSTAIQPERPSDSLRENLITQKNEPAITDSAPADQETLGDTLSITIYAANGKLEPVRVYTDILGHQNPYWITKDDSIRFNFVNTVRVRAVNQYNRMQLLFNGHIIQNYYQQYYNPESNMVELDRSIFEDDPKWRVPEN